MLTLNAVGDVTLAMLDQETVLEEFGRTSSATELRSQGLCHGCGSVPILQMCQEKRILCECNFTQIAFKQVVSFWNLNFLKLFFGEYSNNSCKLSDNFYKKITKNIQKSNLVRIFFNRIFE
jgi:hypothetical protein